MVIFGQETYIHFVAKESRIIRKLFVFNFLSKKVQKRQITLCKICILLELVVIINEFYNEAYIFSIIERSLPISTFLMKKVKNKYDNAGFQVYKMNIFPIL